MPAAHEVLFTHNTIHFPALEPAQPPLGRRLPASTIRDADHTTAPPEIRTRTGETLFITATQATDLATFCHRNHIPLTHRPDIWGDLLEPYLDTEFTAETQAATLTRLHTSGLSPTDVADIRTKVAALMHAYNALHRDWTHLGLADLLDAATSTWIPECHRPTKTDLPTFTTWAMKTVDLPPHPNNPPQTTDSNPNPPNKPTPTNK